MDKDTCKMDTGYLMVMNEFQMSGLYGGLLKQGYQRMDDLWGTPMTQEISIGMENMDTLWQSNVAGWKITEFSHGGLVRWKHHRTIAGGLCSKPCLIAKRLNCADRC